MRPCWRSTRESGFPAGTHAQAEHRPLRRLADRMARFSFSRAEEVFLTDQQLLTYWYIGLAVAAVVVAIAAVLLVLVLTTARRIERSARAALRLVGQIRENTQVIWALQDTNNVARQLSAGAESILGHAAQIAQALHEADLRRRRTAA
jgi:hypothetical protein